MSVFWVALELCCEHLTPDSSELDDRGSGGRYSAFVCEDDVTVPQDLTNRLGSGNTVHEAGFPDLDADVRSSYIANTTIAGLEFADVILIVGSNPRLEAPVLNARCAEDDEALN